MSLPPELKDLSNISLSHANLNTTNLLGAKLTNADLTLASLQGANLTGADLTDADLTGADLNGAEIGFADLTNAKITQDQLDDSNYVNVADLGYLKEVAEKVILLHEPPTSWERIAKKRLVVELRADGKLYIKTPIFKY
jgi:hypothetical protein